MPKKVQAPATPAQTPATQTPAAPPKATTYPSMAAAAGAMKAAVSDFKPCPICGRGIRKELTRPADGTKFEPTICNGFYPKQKPDDTEPPKYVAGCMDRRRAYAAEMGQRLLNREQVTVLAFRPWVVAHIDLQAIEAKVAVAEAENDRLNTLVVAEAKNRAGGYVPPDVFRNLKNGINHEVLPGEKQTASQAYGTYMRARAHLEAAKAEKARLEKEEVEAVAKRTANASPDTQADTSDTPDA